MSAAAVPEATLRLIEELYDNCRKMARTIGTARNEDGDIDVNEVMKILLAHQILLSHVPALVAEIRRQRGVPEPAEPIPFPVDRSRR